MRERFQARKKEASRERVGERGDEVSVPYSATQKMSWGKLTLTNSIDLCLIPPLFNSSQQKHLPKDAFQEI